ncbi:type II secretion system protein GspD [Treponema putidum]|nr:type II and III secretion system protein [Treponema putidum]
MMISVIKKIIIAFSFVYLIFSQKIYGEELDGILKSEKYIIKYMNVKQFIETLPEEIKKRRPSIIEGLNGFIITAGEKEHSTIVRYIKQIDIEQDIYPIELKYINSEELIKYLPPSASRENIILTGNPNLIFFKGSESKKEKVTKELDMVDKPKPQIRYQLLVVQYEKSDNLNWAKNLSLNKKEVAGSSNQKTPMYEFSGVMSNIFNINFDIVSKFGYQFIAKLNFELSENKARVLADTTLNGLTGEEVNFQNTNTFRYVDKTLDANGKPLYGALREITSGLLLKIKGVVSGDQMITMEVSAQVSKQGSGGSTSGVLPPTSEKIVKTKVRSESGKPIIIGGLLQLEKNTDEKKVPGLGDIPVLGYGFKDLHASETVTEMVIYIVPYLHKISEKKKTVNEKLKYLYEKYIEGEEK